MLLGELREVGEVLGTTVHGRKPIIGGFDQSRGCAVQLAAISVLADKAARTEPTEIIVASSQ